MVTAVAAQRKEVSTMGIYKGNTSHIAGDYRRKVQAENGKLTPGQWGFYALCLGADAIGATLLTVFSVGSDIAEAFTERSEEQRQAARTAGPVAVRGTVQSQARRP